MKPTRIFIATLSLALIICMLLPLSVSANSAQTEWRGVDASGAAITDENSPIIVEKEILTLDLSEFPSNYYSDASEYLAYSGKVTAEYHFYNPSDYTVTATLLFPFRQEPIYAADIYDENGVRLRDTDIPKYTVTINGEPIDVQLRHSIYENYSVQKVDGYTYLPVEDDFLAHPYYTPDLPITVCTYTVTGLDDSAYPAATAAFDVPPSGVQDGNALLYIPEQRSFHTIGDMHRVGVGVDNGEKFEVYIIGSRSSALPDWKIYEDGGTKNREEISGRVTLTETREITLYDLAMTDWNDGSGISEVDWYNAFASAIINNETSDGVLIYLDHMSLNVESQLNRWYKYEITLAPGERIVNTVTAPIYPAISARYQPPVYSYTYLLSPAMTWKEFGTLDIYINTPFYLIENSLGDFEKTDAGYRLHLGSLPQHTELELSLSESPKPEKKKPDTRYAAIILLIIFGYILAFIYIIIGTVGLVAIIVTLIRCLKQRRARIEANERKNIS